MQEDEELKAQKFAEWMFRNRWFYFDEKEKKWSYTFEHGTAISTSEYNKNYKKTTKQLFDKFNQEEYE